MPSSAPTTSGVRLSTGYGRLYVAGPSMHIAQRLSGAAFNIKRNAYELSLTLETLRALRKELGVSKQQFASYCTEDVMAWARAAGSSEERVNAMHRQLESGWRPDLPWLDRRAGTPAGDEADENEVEFTPEGVRVYKYRSPYDHQKIMAAICLLLDGAAIMGEVGTGKTRAALESMRYLMDSDQLDLVVVVGKKATLANTWVPECGVWTRDLTPVLLTGITVAKRREIIKRVAAGERVTAPGQHPVLLLNHDVLSLLEDDLLALMQTRRVGFIVDESQKIRNPEAKVTQSAMRLAEAARWRLIMTGSPVIRGEQDIWSQWYTIDLGTTFGANFVQYRREWLIEDPYTLKVTAREGADTEIGLRMRRRGYRVTKEQGIPDLPPRVYQQYPIELTKQQRDAYEDLEDTLVTKLSSDDERYATASNQLAMILRLSQITSGFIKDESGQPFIFDPNPKLHAVSELVEENIRNGSILIWAWYREDVERIAQELRQYNPAIVYGGQNDTVRNRGIQDFMHRRTKLLIGNQATGGVGLNLQVAHMAIFYSQNYNLEDRLQSEGRNHRGGSQIHQQVTYIDLVAQGTIDEIVLGALRRKKSVADAVVDLRKAIGMDQERAA